MGEDLGRYGKPTLGPDLWIRVDVLCLPDLLHYLPQFLLVVTYILYFDHVVREGCSEPVVCRYPRVLPLQLICIVQDLLVEVS